MPHLKFFDLLILKEILHCSINSTLIYLQPRKKDTKISDMYLTAPQFLSREKEFFLFLRRCLLDRSHSSPVHNTVHCSCAPHHVFTPRSPPLLLAWIGDSQRRSGRAVRPSRPRWGSNDPAAARPAADRGGRRRAGRSQGFPDSGGEARCGRARQRVRIFQEAMLGGTG